MIDFRQMQQDVDALAVLSLMGKATYGEVILKQVVAALVDLDARLSAIEAALERGPYPTG